MTDKSKEKPPPQCKAILLCEQTIIQAGSEKVSLIGIVRVLHLFAMPGQTAPMDLFLQLVDGFGRYDVTIEVQDLAEDRVIAKGSGPTVFFPDPLVVRQLILPIPALPIGHAGSYDVIVLANGQEVDRQQFTVVVPGNHGGSQT
jgi:hypothetical protein